jgi:Collagen triple helix repeat (20 copies)
MTSIRITWPTAAFVSAGALLLAALAAAPHAHAATFYACVKKTGSPHVFTRKPNCKKGETRLSWNAAGLVGKTGAQGVRGATATQGASGVTGSTGERGTTGTTGAAGITGERGATGAGGVTGSAGITGEKGATGAGGVTGKEGPTGTAGVDGAVAGYAAIQSGEIDITAEAEVVTVSKTLPAGHYLASAKVETSARANGGGVVETECKLSDGGGALDSSRWLGSLSLLAGKFYGESALPLQAVLNTNATTTLSVLCRTLINTALEDKLTASKGQLSAVQTSSNS